MFPFREHPGDGLAVQQDSRQDLHTLGAFGPEEETVRAALTTLVREKAGAVNERKRQALR
jgi:hypothetical protein